MLYTHFFFAFYLSLVSWFPTKNDCNCQSQNASNILKCNTQLHKCIVVRKTANFALEISPSKNPNKLKLEITKAEKGSANLVYSGNLYVIERPSGEYIVKIPYSIHKGYTWDDTTREDFLNVTYDATKQQLSFEAVGSMTGYQDSKHGYQTAQIKSVLDRHMTSFKMRGQKDIKTNLAKAAAAYFVLEYFNALKK